MACIVVANAQTVSTEAGTKGSDGYSPTSGSPLTVPFNQPYGIAVDGSDRLFISDAQNHRISLLLPGTMVLNKTGSSLQESGYRNLTGSQAWYNQPKGMVFGPDGKLYVCDYGNNAIRVMNGISTVNEAQQVSTFAGDTVISAGGHADGTAYNARFDGPVDIAVDAVGNFYVADNWNEVIRKITPGGIVSTFAGGVGMAGDINGIGTAARFNNILGLEMLDATTLLVADGFNNKIRKINLVTGEVSDFAGTGATGNADGAKANATFNGPSGLAVDAFGNVYVSEGAGSQSNVIRKIDANGNVTTICGAYQNVTQYADGQGTDSRFYQPAMMVFNNAKTILYVCDAGNNTIRSIDLRAKARFIATPTSSNVGIDVQLTSQSLNNPTSYTWEITPATGFTLQGGTTLASQNPILRFNVATSYTVKLTVSNAYGGDDTTRLNYINISSVGLEQIALNKQIKVYPNPNNGSFQIQKEQGFENPNMTYALYDFSGKLIQQGAFNGESVSFSNLSKGIYLIKLSDGTSKFNQKVVVQ